MGQCSALNGSEIVTESIPVRITSQKSLLGTKPTQLFRPELRLDTVLDPVDLWDEYLHCGTESLPFQIRPFRIRKHDILTEPNLAQLFILSVARLDSGLNFVNMTH
jgi:hypothetical protein